MNKKRPNCFIAMALASKQTNAVYTNLIYPTVKNLGFEPVIITEVQHNEIIDNLIMSCLNDADIVIADLTFARQSVYYEAGYAERKIPVIYTCRRDHFLSKEDSSRIHFDLEHKLIIDWINENDETFPPRLERRIRYLTDSMAEEAISKLNAFLSDLTDSYRNPSYRHDETDKEAKERYRILEGYKRPAIHDKDFENKVASGVNLLSRYLKHLEQKQSSGKLKDIEFRNEVGEFIVIVKSELNYLQKCFIDVRYGLRIFLAAHLKDLYDLYLRLGAIMYQRPTKEYQDFYDAVVSQLGQIASLIKSE